MTLATSTNIPRPRTAHTIRFTRWGGWLTFLLLCGHVIFCHGCHGEDVDDELSVPPPTARKYEDQKRANHRVTENTEKYTEKK